MVLHNKNSSPNKIAVYILITIILILQYKFFFIPSNYSSILIKYNTDNCSVIIVLFTSLTLLILAILSKRNLYKKQYFTGANIFFLVYFVTIVLYSLIKYPYMNVGRAASQYSYIFLLLLYFVLMIFFNKYNGLKYFVVCLTIFNIILTTLMIASTIQYNAKGIMFLHFYSVDFGTLYARNGMIRIYSGAGIIMTSAVVSIGFLFSNTKQKLLHLVNVGLSFYQIYYVSQTRMSLVTLIFVFILGMTTFKTKHKILKTLFMLAVTSFAVVILTNEISFSSSEYSYITRIKTIEYFVQYSITHLFGVGILTDVDTTYSSILHSPTGTAYISDVGIIGVLGNFGIIAVIWYWFVIYKFIKIKVDKINRLKLCFLGFYLFSMFTLVPFGYSNMIFIPISMAIIEYTCVNGLVGEKGNYER